jgi:hypothetical protein
MHRTVSEQAVEHVLGRKYNERNYLECQYFRDLARYVGGVHTAEVTGSNPVSPIFLSGDVFSLHVTAASGAKDPAGTAVP